MTMMIKCMRCRGACELRGLGGVYNACKNCNGTGKVKAELKQVVVAPGIDFESGSDVKPKATRKVTTSSDKARKG